MDSLISRQAAIEGKMNLLVRCYDDKLRFKDFVPVEYLQNLPSAEPEIIRCKDCKYAVTGNHAPYCGRLFELGGKDTFLITKDSYCSWAERRIDESD